MVSDAGVAAPQSVARELCGLWAQHDSYFEYGEYKGGTSSIGTLSSSHGRCRCGGTKVDIDRMAGSESRRCLVVALGTAWQDRSVPLRHDSDGCGFLASEKQQLVRYYQAVAAPGPLGSVAREFCSLSCRVAASGGVARAFCGPRSSNCSVQVSGAELQRPGALQERLAPEAAGAFCGLRSIL